MLLGGGQLDGVELLRPESVAELGRNQIGALDAGRMRTTSPEGSNDIDLDPGAPLGWGLGGVVYSRDAPGGPGAGSWGWAGIQNTYFWVDPPRRVGGLLLTQILPFGDRAVLDLLAEFQRGVYALL
jgi:CubicO group peptidase (beta-lactamase class C family)